VFLNNVLIFLIFPRVCEYGAFCGDLFVKNVLKCWLNTSVSCWKRNSCYAEQFGLCGLLVLIIFIILYHYNNGG
jgi:hypothetical protein